MTRVSRAPVALSNSASELEHAEGQSRSLLTEVRTHPMFHLALAGDDAKAELLQ